MVVVTHEIGFARDVANDVVFMDEGVIVEKGPVKRVIDSPREERTRRFLGLVLEHETAGSRPSEGRRARMQRQRSGALSAPRRAG